MDDHDRHSGGVLGLPMAVAEYLDAILNVEQPLFGWRKQVAARKKVSGDRLSVTIQEWPPRSKRLAKQVVPLSHAARSAVADPRVA